MGWRAHVFATATSSNQLFELVIQVEDLKARQADAKAKVEDTDLDSVYVEIHRTLKSNLKYSERSDDEKGLMGTWDEIKAKQGGKWTNVQRLTPWTGWRRIYNWKGPFVYADVPKYDAKL